MARKVGHALFRHSCNACATRCKRSPCRVIIWLLYGLLGCCQTAVKSKIWVPLRLVCGTLPFISFALVLGSTSYLVFTATPCSASALLLFLAPDLCDLFSGVEWGAEPHPNWLSLCGNKPEVAPKSTTKAPLITCLTWACQTCRQLLAR